MNCVGTQAEALEIAGFLHINGKLHSLIMQTYSFACFPYEKCLRRHKMLRRNANRQQALRLRHAVSGHTGQPIDKLGKTCYGYEKSPDNAAKKEDVP